MYNEKKCGETNLKKGLQIMNCGNRLTKEVADMLREMYKNHRDVMFAEAKEILGDYALAEDAVQQAFLKLIKKFENFQTGDFEITRSFLRIVVKNVAIDMYNSRNKNGSNCEYIDEFKNDEVCTCSLTKTPCDEVIEKESNNRIYEIIRKLPQKYRDVLILEKIYGYSQREIAEILNISYDAVKKRMERAKKKVKDGLRKEELI